MRIFVTNGLEAGILSLEAGVLSLEARILSLEAGILSEDFCYERLAICPRRLDTTWWKNHEKDLTNWASAFHTCAA